MFTLFLSSALAHIEIMLILECNGSVWVISSNFPVNSTSDNTDCRSVPVWVGELFSLRAEVAF